MKKFIAKLVLFTIISTTLVLVNYAGSIIEAANITAYTGVFDEAKENPCVKSTELEEGYIITKIEEPLEIAVNDEEGADFRQRKCYRHTFQYSDPTTNIGLTTKTELSKTACPLSTAETLVSDPDSMIASYTCREIQVILSKGGTSMIYGYIGMIYQWGASIVGIIAVTVIILSGIQISAAGGDPEAITSARKRILQSLAGIAVLFLSGLILYTINPNFFTK